MDAHFRTGGRTILIFVLAATLLTAKASAFDYTDQDSWRAVCGDMQSPIDIDPHVAHVDEHEKTQGEDGRLHFHLPPAPATTFDAGHALQVDAAPGSWAMLRGRRFQLLQAHFHAPGEHALAGVVEPVEGHLVFRAASGRLAVVAVRYRPGPANPVVAMVLTAYRDGANASLPEFDMAGLLPAQRGYFHYLGSLTTPPLAQNVEWYVMTQPASMSAGQIESFGRIHGGNNRRLQPLNGRPVLRFDDAS